MLFIALFMHIYKQVPKGAYPVSGKKSIVVNFKIIIYVGKVNVANFFTRQTGKQELPVSGDSADFLNV